MILAAGLTSLDYSVIQAADGPSLLDCYKEHRSRIELLILDVDLPERSGLDCLRDIRAENARRTALAQGQIDYPANSDIDRRYQ